MFTPFKSTHSERIPHIQFYLPLWGICDYTFAFKDISCLNSKGTQAHFTRCRKKYSTPETSCFISFLPCVFFLWGFHCWLTYFHKCSTLRDAVFPAHSFVGLMGLYQGALKVMSNSAGRALICGPGQESLWFLAKFSGLHL